MDLRLEWLFREDIFFENGLKLLLQEAANLCNKIRFIIIGLISPVSCRACTRIVCFFNYFLAFFRSTVRKQPLYSRFTDMRKRANRDNVAKTYLLCTYL